MHNFPSVKADGTTCKNIPALKRQATICYIADLNMFYLSKLYSIVTEWLVKNYL
jgi:hypothetical protein